MAYPYLGRQARNQDKIMNQYFSRKSKGSRAAALWRLSTSFACLFAALFMVAGAAAPVRAEDPAVVATIDGKPITDADLALAAEDLGEYLARIPKAQQRAQLIDLVVNMRLLAQASEKEGLADSDAFRNRMAYLRERALRDLYFDEVISKQATLQEMRKAYDDAIAKTEPEQEVRARHILVKTKEEADAIAAELKGGADFAELAKSKSTDTGSGQAGGDLGYFTKDRMVPPFAEAAFALEPGQTSDPVESQFGWHIIKVEDKRKQEPPAFESVVDQLRQIVLRDKLGTAIEALKAAAKIEIMPAPETEAPKKSN